MEGFSEGISDPEGDSNLRVIISAWTKLDPELESEPVSSVKEFFPPLSSVREEKFY